jgi:hypothetical protein
VRCASHYSEKYPSGVVRADLLPLVRLDCRRREVLVVAVIGVSSVSYRSGKVDLITRVISILVRDQRLWESDFKTYTRVQIPETVTRVSRLLARGQRLYESDFRTYTRVQIPEPVTRVSRLLARGQRLYESDFKICTRVQIPEPVTRVSRLLARGQRL